MSRWVFVHNDSGVVGVMSEFKQDIIKNIESSDIPDEAIERIVKEVEAGQWDRTISAMEHLTMSGLASIIILTDELKRESIK